MSAPAIDARVRSPLAPFVDDGRRKDWLRAAGLARENARVARRMARLYRDPNYLAEATKAYLRALHYLYWARQFAKPGYPEKSAKAAPCA